MKVEDWETIRQQVLRALASAEIASGPSPHGGRFVRFSTGQLANLAALFDYAPGWRIEGPRGDLAYERVPIDEAKFDENEVPY